MSGYKILHRNGRGKEEEDGEVQIELTAAHLHERADMGDEESASEGERADEGVPDDSRSLITEEDEIDENGVAKNYEVALKHIGFGLFHILLVLINGIALLSDAVEVLAVAFVLPILQEDDEFGASDVQNAVLSSVIFIGMLFGSFGWGGFADVVGRRFVLLGSLTLNGIFGVASAFSPNISVFIVCRFISGIGVGGSLPVIFPYIAEFTRNKYRGPYMGAQAFFWTFGRLVCGGFAWVILPLTISRFHSWRLFIALSAFPALLGALLYFLLPESPRYLLEHGRQEKALRALRLVHRLNHFYRRNCHFRIKSIRIEKGLANEDGVAFGMTTSRRISQRLTKFGGQLRQVWRQTTELYSRKLLLRSVLLSVILFKLAFGAYGVVLWFPSYVQQLSDEEKLDDFKSFCHTQAPANASLSDYCGCEDASFRGLQFTNVDFSNLKLSYSSFYNVTFTNVTFTDFSLEQSNFNVCVLENVRFVSRCSFNHVNLHQTVFNRVNTSGLSVCDGEVEEGRNEGGCDGNCEDDVIVNAQEGGNGSCDNVEVECEETDNSDVYRDLFLVSASSFPGNIASAIAVYFLRRSYWMAISLFLSTASVFALYVTHSEVYVVIVLCVFAAVTTPAWNDSSLLITELYPTHLRTTAMGVHLTLARVGAILGTNVFGLFIHVNPSIPILLTACVLLVGGLAALPLPKTTRKTLLQ